MAAKKFSVVQVEAVLCLQEAFIDYANDHVEWSQTIHDKVGGQFALKNALMHVIPAVEAMWHEALTDDERESWIYDWEFCPALVRHGIDWDKTSHCTLHLFPDAWERMKAHDVIHRTFNQQQRSA